MRSVWRAVCAFLVALTFPLSPGAAQSGQLTPLDSVEQFKKLFNQGAGKPRLVLLLSPT